jgi:replicative DNA helicase
LIKHQRPIKWYIKELIKKFTKKVHQKVYQEAQDKHQQEFNIDGISKISDQKDKKD